MKSNLLEKDLDTEQELINDMASFTRDPLGFVDYAFPWGKGELEKHDGPDKWQIEELTRVRDSLKANPFMTIREAIASGHGIGKGAESSWLLLWAMSTCEDTRGIITANTETQLKTKSWAELSKWYRICITKHWFTLTATALFSVNPEHAKTWRIDMIPWSEDKSEAFAGLHNQGKRVILIFDEASAISDKIWEVSDGALTDKDTEILWFVFGNPTRTEGRFRECFRKLRHRWEHHQIDSRSCKMTNKEELNKMIEDFGASSDYCKVRVLGQFPSASSKQFIGSDIVDLAIGRKIDQNEYYFAAKIIGVDPAWSGKDATLVYMRQGNFVKFLGLYRNLEDDFKMAGYIGQFEDEEQADAVFIDYGYGTGIYSAGLQLNRHWMLIPFGAGATKQGYLNKRANMWGDMKDWMKAGGCLPKRQQLADDLVGPEYEILSTGANAGKLKLESKKDMDKRGIPSPSEADAVAITFAHPVIPKNRYQGKRVEGVNVPQSGNFANSAYDLLK